jgi:hypothetical protein
LRTRVLLALLAALAGACPRSGTDAGPADAGPYPPDLSCLGAPPPTTAPDPVPIMASINEGQTFTPLAGAILEMRLRSDDTVLDSGTANASGNVLLALASGGAPVDAYGVAAAAGFTTLHLHPFRPFAGDDPTIPFALLTPAQHAAQQQAIYGATADTALGLLRITIVDCDNIPIEGATVMFAPVPGAVFYDPESGAADPLRTSTTAAGTIIAFDVPVGDVTVSAHYQGTDLPPRTARAEAGVFVALGIAP